jgi:hypothetical protein
VKSVSQHNAAARGVMRAAMSRPTLRLQNDRRLVALTRAGSGPAFSVIVERYRAPLLAYTSRLVGPDEAEDALQQTFANALGALHRDDRVIQAGGASERSQRFVRRRVRPLGSERAGRLDFRRGLWLLGSAASGARRAVSRACKVSNGFISARDLWRFGLFRKETLRDTKDEEL